MGGWISCLQWRNAYREKLAELTAKAAGIVVTTTTVSSSSSSSSAAGGAAGGGGDGGERAQPPAWVRHPAYATRPPPRPKFAAEAAAKAEAAHSRNTPKARRKRSGPGWRRLRLGDGVAEWEVPFTSARFGALVWDNRPDPPPRLNTRPLPRTFRLAVVCHLQEYECTAQPVALCNPVLADSTLKSPFEVINKWVLVQRGVCSFVAKARRVQEARARGECRNEPQLSEALGVGIIHADIGN